MFKGERFVFRRMDIARYIRGVRFRMSTESYNIIRPIRQDTPVIFASPHSGRDYPASLLEVTGLDSRAIRSSEDAFVDRLFAAAPDFGAPLLVARTPRAYVDLNRAVDELDPALIEGVDRPPHNPRISSGLGVIPRVVSNGRAIYRGKITMADAQERLARHWHPYHNALRDLVEESRAGFGKAVLVDCHSMPHEAIEAHARGGVPHPEIVLGDRFGAAAGREVMDLVESAFRAAGLRVVRNAPFAGAYIAQAYGRPSRGCHVVQIEIDRSLYMDEARILPRRDFAAFQALMTKVIAQITDHWRERALAAE